MEKNPGDTALPSIPGQPLEPMQFDVVSVQSQVVYGQVGNTVAVPALQALGLRVAAVPTVVLSNTPHHPTLHGGPVPLDWFQGYLADLHAREALRRLRAVVVGYLGGPEQAHALARWLGALLADRPQIQVFIDPVIGDEDVGIYVDPGLVGAYRGHLLPMADVLVPNGFELGLLGGRPVADLDQVVDTARALLRGRTRAVIATSAAPGGWRPGNMRIAVVEREGADIIEHPRLATTPKGTGDLFSATLAAHVIAGEGLVDAARRASARVVEVLQASARAGSAEMLVYPGPGERLD